MWRRLVDAHVATDGPRAGAAGQRARVGLVPEARRRLPPRPAGAGGEVVRGADPPGGRDAQRKLGGAPVREEVRGCEQVRWPFVMLM